MFGSRNFLFAKASAAVGGLFAWGQGAGGRLGLGNTTSYSSPKQVGALTDWVTPAAAYNFSVCAKTDGTLWSWGVNSNGRLGLGDTTSRSSPVQIGGLTNWAIPTNGENFCIVTKTDGTLWSWGYNGQGRLGFGYPTSYSSPMQIGSVTTWKTPSSGGSSAMCVRTNGSLWVWGANGNGQLGVGDTSPRNYGPVQLGSLTNWAKPSNGTFTSMCVKTDGTLWMWGNNNSGQLGQGNTTNRSSPVQVGALTDWATPSTYNIFGSYVSALCVKTDGTLWAWGNNTYRQLGLGDNTNRSSPTQVGALTNWYLPQSGGSWSACTKTDGTLWTWGINAYGNLGTGNTTLYSSPVQVGALTNWATPSTSNGHFLCTKKVPANAPANTVAPVVSGTAQQTQTLSSTTGTWSNSPVRFSYQWQRGTSDIVGATSSTYTIQAADVGSTLRCVVTATNINGSGTANSANTGTVIAYVGKLYAWGRNNQRQLGQGSSTTDRSSPVQVGSATTWTQVSGGGYHVAGLVGGALETWGSNSSGQLGIGTSGGSIPYPSGLYRANTAFVNAGRFQTRIITTTGQLWSWGDNTYGGLGLGNTTSYSSPKQVGSLTNWAKIDALASFSALAIKTDGTLWSWGGNLNGRLGLGNTTNYSSPKQIGSDTDWASIPSYGGRSRWAGAAIKTNGTLWTWGNGAYGNLGHGNTTSYSSPKQVGAGTTWAKIANMYTGFTAVKTDGTLWTWGSNQNGQLGLGDTTNRSSPVQVGALTNWAIPVGGYYFNGCIKTDGTMWSWGQNNYGQLGLGNTTYYSSPKQIGSLTTWTRGGTTDRSMMAIST